MSRNTLSLKGLSVDIHNKTAVSHITSNVSFNIKPGETLALVGESGSGKSITSLAITGLLPSQARIAGGQIEFEGQEIQDWSEHQFLKLRGQKIATIFQEPMTSLNPLHKVGKQIIEVIVIHRLSNRKAAIQRAKELLVEVGLPKDSYNKYPHQLSGGQQQRVMIAIALACRPKLLIADEPTTALDVTVQKQILILLKSLQSQYGMAMLLITHDLGIVADIADQVAVMYQGKLEEQGPTNRVFANPQSAYTKGLIACRPPLAFTPTRLATFNDVIDGKKIPIRLDKRSSDSNSTILEVQNLSKEYSSSFSLFNKSHNSFLALDDINLKVFTGETVGIVGESGSGKTTLARIIMRLLKPSAGKVIFDGCDITNLSQKELFETRKKIQYIFQNPYGALNSKMKVQDILLEPIVTHDRTTPISQHIEFAKYLLSRVGLQTKDLNKFPHEFSGGQRQRISIARALTLKPKVLVCDECVSALDVSVQAQILNLLLDLQEEQKLTYLFISHDLAAVKFFSDRVAVMYQGKIVECNEAESLYKSPQDEFTRKLLGAIHSQYPGETNGVLNEIYTGI